jgi:chemotaxis protein CheY-P-specific phosphatase CheC
VAVVGLYNKYVEGIRKLNKQLLMTEDNEKKKELEKVRDSIVKEAANEFNKLEKK